MTDEQRPTDEDGEGTATPWWVSPPRDVWDARPPEPAEPTEPTVSSEPAADENTTERYGAVYDVWAPTDTLGRETGGAGASFGGMLDVSSAVDTVYSPFEVACLDLAGREAGRPVSDLLGGAMRDRVPFSGYLFYKWAAHPGDEPDVWGEALDPDQVVTQARRMVDGWGFGSLGQMNAETVSPLTVVLSGWL